MRQVLTFKQFIAERAVDAEPTFDSHKLDAAIDLLNANCKDALWMLDQDTPIYRGMSAKIKTFATVDTSATERKSQNTSNYYTVILDTNPAMKDFPKRSRSFIGSTAKARASTYSWSGGLYVLVPYDGVPIGWVGQGDMWDTKITLFRHTLEIENFNDYFEDLGIKPDIESFMDFSKRLAAGDAAALKKFKSVFGFAKTDFSKKSFIQQIWDAYSPVKTKHRVFTTATMPHELAKKSSEVWVGGKVMVMRLDMWNKIRKAWREKHGE